MVDKGHWWHLKLYFCYSIILVCHLEVGRKRSRFQTQLPETLSENRKLLMLPRLINDAAAESEPI